MSVWKFSEMEKMLDSSWFFNHQVRYMDFADTTLTYKLTSEGVRHRRGALYYSINSLAHLKWTQLYRSLN